MTKQNGLVSYQKYDRVLLLTVLLMLFTIKTYGQNQVIEIDDYNSRLIGKELLIYKDISGKVEPQELWYKYRINKLEKSDQVVFAKPSTSASYWLLFSIISVRLKYDIAVYFAMTLINREVFLDF